MITELLLEWPREVECQSGNGIFLLTCLCVTSVFIFAVIQSTWDKKIPISIAYFTANFIAYFHHLLPLTAFTIYTSSNRWLGGMGEHVGLPYRCQGRPGGVVVYQYTQKKFAKIPKNTQNSSKYTQNYT